MKTGISTGCLYPELTENSIKILTCMGFDRFEIFFNSFSELEPDYLDRLRYYLDSHSARVVSVHPFVSSFESFLLFSAYERRFIDGAAFYEMFYRAASRIGADKVVLHGLNTSYASSLSDKEYFRRYGIMQENALKYGVELLQENVNIFRSSRPEFISGMKEALPGKAAFVLDVKQALRAGVDPLSMADAMGDRLRHVHISDRNSEGMCVLPFAGNFDLNGFISGLAHRGYDGDLIIEVYRTGFDTLPQLMDSGVRLAQAVERITG